MRMGRKCKTKIFTNVVVEKTGWIVELPFIKNMALRFSGKVEFTKPTPNRWDKDLMMMMV